MLIVRLMGGLGNQLFQYAFSLWLQGRYKKKVWLDAQALSENRHEPLLTQREYSLHIFKMRPLICNQWHRAYFQQSRYWRLNALAAKLFDLSKYHCIEENDNFSADNLPENALLLGYWQDLRYVQGVETLLRRHLQFRHALKGQALNWQRAIQAQQVPVAVHVRRGDYLKPHVAKELAPLPPAYYQQALQEVKERFENAFFYIFSDDTQWCQTFFTQMKFPCAIVPNNFEQPFADFQLMTQCRHFIIANSTFSWWGAWLSQAPDKQVWSPKRWYAVEELNRIRRPKLVPSCWHSI
ncbi:MAG: alpha-1,2-fucosyltransferase [Cytophagales bacterium]|nr:alpha-1,2-fucosyltransferase [Bernardetiaceae bacterium]MDW8210198.1 alpha-1,2-fucosyltransferase [Cytophagales bacterium]